MTYAMRRQDAGKEGGTLADMKKSRSVSAVIVAMSRPVNSARYPFSVSLWCRISEAQSRAPVGAASAALWHGSGAHWLKQGGPLLPSRHVSTASRTVGLDFNVRRLPLGSSQRLVNHYPRVGQGVPLALQHHTRTR